MGVDPGVARGQGGALGPTPEVEEGTEDRGGDVTGHAPTTETENARGTENETGIETGIGTETGIGDDTRHVEEQGPARAHVRAATRGEGVGAVEDIVVVTAAATVPHEPLAVLAVAHPLPTEGPSLLPLPSLTS